MIDTLDIAFQKTSKSKLNDLDVNNVEFGRVFSDHMFTADFKGGQWTDHRIIPYGNLSISPANTTIHYSSTIFEGLKAYRSSKNNEILVFRPKDNARRMAKSAERMCMPAVPRELFISAMEELIRIDQKWVPDAPGTSLYIRPFQFASDPYIGIRPSDEYQFLIITGPVGPYYSAPVKVLVETKYTRAAPGGTGFAKTGGNYAASLYPAKFAQEKGYNQLIWTDALTHEYVEESGTMNLMFVINDILVTPPTGDTILEGITRDSILRLAKNQGIPVEVRPVKVREVIDAIEKGTMQEAFGAGTAATIAPIALIGYDGRDYQLPPVEGWKYSNQILSTLNGIKAGEIEDRYDWVHTIKL